MTANEKNESIEVDAPDLINEARLWKNNGWTARVIKNEDDEGWAVEMIKEGESEPALVGPWTMGRDKKNPKPLGAAAFNTLVKTASEFRQRQEQQLHATLHQNIAINGESGRISIALDIVGDEGDAYALLTARDATDEVLAQVCVPAEFTLNRASASAWIDNEYRKPE
jgi:maltose-binding protein MalE